MPSPFRLPLSVFRLSAALIPSLLLVASARASIAPVEAGPAFPLVASGAAAPIVVPAGAPKVVLIAAGDLADDVARVTGIRPRILNTPPAAGAPRVELSLAPALAGRWEAFRLSATAGVLSIEGSDPRGLAYGIFELSRRIGVSPWYWWADVPVVHRDALRLSLGADPVDQPAVRYRGIFINDEDWGLEPWAAKTFEPGSSAIGPKAYAKLFELMLRLRANTLWPAMHPCTKPFFTVPGNAAVADDYDIVVGSSHAEPMLRNNVGEWTAPKNHYNYLTHRDEVLAYWEQRVKERTSGESIFTIGMRGIHDSPIMGPKTQTQRITTLEKIFADQRSLLARYLGDGDPARVPQMFCPYKEVLPDYEAGLRVPPDVTILWPDDNFGYIRHFPTPAELARPGGGGVYYHLSYLGAPFAWTWIDAQPPALVWSEMMRAYEQGARRLWIANVGDLKNTERSAEFFLDLAWHADRTTPDAAKNFLRAASARDFGPDNADAIASLLDRSQRLAFARRPEFLQWNLPRTHYRPTTLTRAEIGRRLADYAALVADTRAVAARLPADAQDAFYELVAYPVESAAAANDRYFQGELSRLDPAAAKAHVAASRAAASQVDALTARYNHDIAGGKWNRVVTAYGLSSGDWKSFQSNHALPPADSANPNAQPSTPNSPPPEDARPGDFYESAGVVSLVAGHFTGQADLPGGGWRAIPGLGRTGDAVTVLPSTLAGAPSLTYRFHTTTRAAPVLHVRLLPTFPIEPGRGLCLALAIDDGAPVPLAVTDGFNPRSSAWKQRVVSNSTEATATLDHPLEPGWHELRLVAVDTGVVVDKIVLDLGGLRPSYDGPPETRVPAP